MATNVEYCATWFYVSESGDLAEHRTGFVPTRELALRLADLIIQESPKVRSVGPIVTIGAI